MATVKKISTTGLDSKLKDQTEILNKDPKSEFTKMIDLQSTEIKKALPVGFGTDQFVRGLKTLVGKDPKLLDCDPITIISASMEVAQLGLSLSKQLGQAYIIPYKGKATLQIGYLGLLELAYRSGLYEYINAACVYSNCVFEPSLGSDPKLRHIPHIEPEGDPIAYYAICKRKDGPPLFYVMSKKQVDDFRKRYTEPNSPAWRNSYDEMAKKVCMKRLLKYIQKSVELGGALSSDGGFKSSISNEMSAVEAQFEDL